MKEAPRPNFLFLLPDQHRHDFLPGGEAPVRMPNLQRLMQRGTTFTNAFTPSPLCAPARACLATGRSYARCGVAGNDDNLPLGLPTYYQSLRQGGYAVLGCGKFDLAKGLHDWEMHGRRRLHEWGFTGGIDNEGKWDAVNSGRVAPRGPYMSFLQGRGLREAHVADFDSRRKDHLATHPTPLPDDAYCDNWLSDNGLALLRDVEPGRPWHLVVNFTGPHEPWDVTAAMQARWQDVEFPMPHAGVGGADIHQPIRRNYAAMLENIDRNVGRFIEAVAERGDLNNTIVIYSSDHGEMLGDCGRWHKSHWRTPSAGIPMILAGPGIEAGRTCETPAALHDLSATMLDFAGLPAMEDTDARSLRAVLAGQTAAPRSCVCVGLADWRMIVDGEWKCVCCDGQAPQLFSRRQDPWDEHDLAARYPQIVSRMAAGHAHA